MIAQNLCPPLLVPILADYQRGIPQARESQVLQLFTTIVNTCQSAMTDSSPKILGATLGCTLEMITANMEDYPEHRINFYLLLTSILTHTFQSFFQIPQASQVSFSFFVGDVVCVFFLESICFLTHSSLSSLLFSFLFFSLPLLFSLPLFLFSSLPLFLSSLFSPNHTTETCH